VHGEVVGFMGVELVINDGTPWWESPDIWVVPGTDPGGAPGSPVAGMPAYLWATVHNEGDTDVQQVQVDFWVADPSSQIRKSTAHHIGTSSVDIAAGGSQDVLCGPAWPVTFINGGHECVVVEASSPADPLAPPPADPDLLDPPDYPQIAQRNLSVLMPSGAMLAGLRITVSAGLREEKVAVLELHQGTALPAAVLHSLGAGESHYVSFDRVAAGLSTSPLGERDKVPEAQTLRIAVTPGKKTYAYLNVAAREPLANGEYTVARVIQREGERVAGGISVVIRQPHDRKDGAR
jgi:hypothetical protein